MALCPPGDCLPQKTIPTLWRKRNDQILELHYPGSKRREKWYPSNGMAKKPRQHDIIIKLIPNWWVLSNYLSIWDLGTCPQKMSQRLTKSMRKQSTYGMSTRGICSSSCITKLHTDSSALLKMQELTWNKQGTNQIGNRGPSKRKPTSTLAACQEYGNTWKWRITVYSNNTNELELNCSTY